MFVLEGHCESTKTSGRVERWVRNAGVHVHKQRVWRAVIELEDVALLGFIPLARARGGPPWRRAHCNFRRVAWLGRIEEVPRQILPGPKELKVRQKKWKDEAGHAVDGAEVSLPRALAQMAARTEDR